MSDTEERLETLLALHLDALDRDEAATVRARIASDAEWRAPPSSVASRACCSLNSESICAGPAPAAMSRSRSAWTVRPKVSYSALGHGVGSGTPAGTRSRHFMRMASTSG